MINLDLSIGETYYLVKHQTYTKYNKLMKRPLEYCDCCGDYKYTKHPVLKDYYEIQELVLESVLFYENGIELSLSHKEEFGDEVCLEYPHIRFFKTKEDAEKHIEVMESYKEGLTDKT